jgi:hypothetical protein
MDRHPLLFTAATKLPIAMAGRKIIHAMTDRAECCNSRGIIEISRTLRLRLRLGEQFAAEHGLKQLGVFAVCKTVQRVPRIIFADRTTFRRNAQLGVKVAHLI